MGNKISKVILAANVKVDRDYVNVCDANMLDVVNNHAVVTANNYSFIRRNRTLKVHFNYAQILTCNYMAFQNTDYSNKWFFAWIDNIEYVDDNCVEIEFTIDFFSTWWGSISKLPVFVEREHVNDDSFGIHNLPEPISPDKLITNFTDYHYYSDYSIIVFFMYSQIEAAQQVQTFMINDTYMTPACAFRYDASQSGITNMITDLSATGEMANATILTIFMIPNDFIPTSLRNIKYLGLNVTTVDDVINFPAPTNLNGYIPVNKKCLTYPYNFITICNGSGEKTYKYEKFGLAGQGAGTFKIVGGVLPNGGATLYPMAYDGIVYENVAESLTLGDLPMIAVATDSYAAWLAQKSSGTVIQGIMSTLTGALAGAMKGGVAGAAIGAGAGLIGGVSNYIAQEERARAEKDHAVGSNNTEIDILNGNFGFTLHQRCAVADDAERIDKFFSQFGYNVSTVKIPNYQGRQYWNYVKINGSVGYGSLPEEARNQINSIMNKGTTIWHSHANLGNYFAGGTKMENPII